jgi:hypothetical protein
MTSLDVCDGSERADEGVCTHAKTDVTARFIGRSATNRGGHARIGAAKSSNDRAKRALTIVFGECQFLLVYPRDRQERGRAARDNLTDGYQKGCPAAEKAQRAVVARGRRCKR